MSLRKALLFKDQLHVSILCYFFIFISLGGIGGALCQALSPNNQTNIPNTQALSRANATTEREIVLSNRTFRVVYAYSTNVIPYSGPTNVPVVKQRRAMIDVFEIAGTNIVKIDGTMKGIFITTGNFDSESDWFYVTKALSLTNTPSTNAP